MFANDLIIKLKLDESWLVVELELLAEGYNLLRRWVESGGAGSTGTQGSINWFTGWLVEGATECNNWEIIYDSAGRM